MKISATALALAFISITTLAAAEYSAPIPAFSGAPYAGMQGAVPQGPVDFGREFVSMKRAFIDMEGVNSGPAAPMEFLPSVDGVAGPLLRIDDPVVEWSVTLEVPVPLSLRDGQAQIEVAIGVDSFDGGGTVTSATMRVESDLVPGSLLERPLINEQEGGFGGDLDAGNRFGFSVSHLGDVDGDGVGDLAAGDPSGTQGGSVWILFMNPDGTVRDEQQINRSVGGFVGDADVNLLGERVEGIGDIDGNGVPDVAAVADWFDASTFWVLLLQADGTVVGEQKIAPGVGGFQGSAVSFAFGYDLAAVADLDGDGRNELAVSEPGNGTAGPDVGAVWILFFNSDGSVRDEVEITRDRGGFNEPLADGSNFGAGLASGDDFDGDGRYELAVQGGGAWILYLGADGRVTRTEDQPGCSTGLPGDVDGDGIGDLLCTTRLVMRNADGTLKDQTDLTRMLNGWGLDGVAKLSRIPGPDSCSLRFAGSTSYIDEEEFGAYEGVMLPIFDGSGSMEVRVERDAVQWCTPPRASGFDLISGDLDTLRSSGGDFSAAVTSCLADDLAAGEQAHLPLPGPGQGFFFIVRRVTDDGAGSYDSRGRGAAGPRDAAIAASGQACN